MGDNTYVNPFQAPLADIAVPQSQKPLPPSEEPSISGPALEYIVSLLNSYARPEENFVYRSGEIIRCFGGREEPLTKIPFKEIENKAPAKLDATERKALRENAEIIQDACRKIKQAVAGTKIVNSPVLKNIEHLAQLMGMLGTGKTLAASANHFVGFDPIGRKMPNIKYFKAVDIQHGVKNDTNREEAVAALKSIETAFENLGDLWPKALHHIVFAQAERSEEIAIANAEKPANLGKRIAGKAKDIAACFTRD